MKAQKRKLGLLEVDGASEREQNFGERADDVELSRIGRSLGNSDRAFYKELAKVIEASDVILEVLDARDPLGTRCYDMEKMVLKSGPHKNLVLLLNKIVKEILRLCPAKTLIILYKLPNFNSVDDFLQKVATVRGQLKKGGVVDVEATARIILHDWNEAEIPYYTMPPSR